MRSYLWLWVLGVCVMVGGGAGAVGRGLEGFDRVLLVSHADIEVSLLVRPSATPADVEFIGFLINNKTGKAIGPGTSAHYRIDKAELIDRATGKLVSTQSLASGNDYDLFYRDVMDIGAERPALPTGELRRLAYSSGYTMGLLGIPEAGSKGYTIRATVHFTLSFGENQLSTPDWGVPIQFDWLPPDEAGMEAMRKRVREVVVGGDPGVRQDTVLATLLDHPEIGRTVSTGDLLAGLDAWEQRGGKILAYLDEHRVPNDGLVDYALGVIGRRDHLRISVLKDSKSLRDVRLIEPLRAWATSSTNTSGSEDALEFLSKQLDLAPDRDALTAELGQVWLGRSPITRSGRVQEGREWHWVYEMRLLELTRDRNLIPVVVPFLERKEIVVDAKKMALFNSGISTRACDVAYNTIVGLLGRDDPRFKVGTGRRAVELRPAVEAEYARRDELIAKLKREVR